MWRWDIKEKSQVFRVNHITGSAFIAIADLLNICTDELLENLIENYIDSIQNSITDLGIKYPVFGNKYPFIIP